jgi:iron complex outermembrane recepter protein
MKKLIRPDRSSVAVDAFVQRSLRSARMRALRTSAVTVGLALSVGSAAAWSEEPAKADEIQLLEEIVVTAQFREQNLQTTPVAITAVNAQQLDERSMSHLTDLSSIAPNLIIAKGTGNNGPAAQTFIRGVGQSDGHPALEPGVGIYVDDVYHGLLLGTDLDLTDLDRVEVLRGPQGTLAGKNSIGGSIKLFSKKPSDQSDGYTDLTYGDFNRIDFRAGSNFTLVQDQLYVRLSGSSKHVDGYMDRLDYGCVNPSASGISQIAVQPGCKLGTLGGQDVHAARIALRWIASDSIENNLIADATVDRSEVPAIKLISANSNRFPVDPATGIRGTQFVTGPNSYTTYATFQNPGFTDPARYTGQPGAGTHGAISLSTIDPINAYGVSDTIDWKLADNYTLKSITGYRRYSGQYSIFTGGSPYTTSLLDDTWSQRQFTQELRLNGTSFSQLDWTIGAYYYKQLARFGGLKMLQPGDATETLFTGSDPVFSQNKSGFAHGVWRVTDELSAIAGIRYTKEDKEYTFSRLNPYAPQFASYTPPGLLDGSTGTYAGSHTDYRAGVEYQWTPEIMTYAQWSTGFRGGGVNPRPFVVQQEVSFKPETMHATEIGAKSDLLDHHLRANVALFWSKYKDILLTDTTPTKVNGVIVAGGNNATPVNVGAADIKGAELELEARPFGGLQIDGSVSYLDFKFTSINTAAATIPGVSLNTQEPFAPKRKANLGLQYEIPMGTAGSLVPRFDAAYQAQFFTDITNTEGGRVGGYTLLNARVTWKSKADEWETAAVVTNLGDKFYYVNKINTPTPGNNILEGQPGTPREWMVTVRRNF